jgi:hypothetical protein
VKSDGGECQLWDSYTKNPIGDFLWTLGFPGAPFAFTTDAVKIDKNLGVLLQPNCSEYQTCHRMDCTIVVSFVLFRWFDRWMKRIQISLTDNSSRTGVDSTTKRQKKPGLFSTMPIVSKWAI